MKLTPRFRVHKHLRNARTLPAVKTVPLFVLLPLVGLLLVSSATVAYRGIISQNNAINLDQGLVGQWGFNGDAADSSGNGNHGTVTGATLTEDRFGNANSAYSFDGNDYISHTTTGMQASSGTISGWVNPSQSADWGFWQTHDSSGQNWLDWIAMFSYTSDTFYYRIGDGSACCNNDLTYSPTSSEIPVGQWSHLVFTWDGSDMKMYVNNQLIRSRSNAALQSVMDPGARIGQGHDRMMKGSIDDMRAYDRAISEAEIEALYNSQNQAANLHTSNLQKGLVGWWKLDGDAKDSSGYYNHGTINADAAPTSDRFNGANKAYSFDGTEDHIEMPASADYFTGDQDESISLWVKHNGSTNIFSANSWRRRLFGNQWTIIDTDNTYYNLSVGSTGDNTWHHIVYTKEGASVKAFVDGVETASATLAANLHPANSYYWIAQNCSGSCGGANYNGLVDDVRIYNRALTTQEIQDLHDSYEPAVSVSSLQKDLAGHWDFNGGAKDRTPSYNHGTVNGATLITDRNGRSNNAYSFDGTDDWIDDIQPDVPSSPNVFTVAGVFKPDNQSSRFFTPASVGIDQWIEYDAANQRLGVMVAESSDTNQRTRYSSSGSVPLNTWTQWAVSINDKHIKIYINGELNAEYTETIDIAGWTNTWRLGQRGNSTGWFMGDIDDIRIYNRILSEAEVERLYETY